MSTLLQKLMLITCQRMGGENPVNVVYECLLREFMRNFSANFTVVLSNKNLLLHIFLKPQFLVLPLREH